MFLALQIYTSKVMQHTIRDQTKTILRKGWLLFKTKPTKYPPSSHTYHLVYLRVLGGQPIYNFIHGDFGAAVTVISKLK